MYGNDRLPGVDVGNEYRNNGSMWLGYTQSTWFKTVMVKGAGDTAVEIPQGTVMIEQTDGTYAPMKGTDIVGAADKLPGARLVVVADSTAKTGTKTVANGVTTDTPSSVLCGTHGRVDRARVMVGTDMFADLAEDKQKWLGTQLEAWGIQLDGVQQS